MKRNNKYFLFLLIVLLSCSCYISKSQVQISSDLLNAMRIYYQADSLSNIGELAASESLFYQAQELFEKEQEFNFYISSLINRAKMKQGLREIQDADELIKIAEDAFLKYDISREDTLYSNYLNRTGYAHLIRNELENAKLDYIASSLIREDLNIHDYTLSNAYNNLGYIFNLLGDLTNAEKYFNKCIVLRKEILDSYDPRLARTYATVGAFLIKLAHYNKALEYLGLARNIYINFYDDAYSGLSGIYNNLGIINFNMGEFSTAENFYLKAIQIFSRFPQSNENNLSYAYNNLGLIYYEMDSLNFALDWFYKNVDLLKNESPSGLFRAYIKIANTYKKLGNYEQAKYFYEQAIANIIYFHGNDHHELATAYLNFGLFYSENNEIEKGLELYYKALEIYLEHYGLKHPNISRCYYNIGANHNKQNMPDSALYYIQKSLIAVVEDFDAEDISTNPTIQTSISNLRLLSSLKLKADVLLKKYQQNGKGVFLEHAFSTLEVAVNVIENIRLEYLSEESKLYLAQNEKDTYYSIIQIALLLFEKTNKELFKEMAFVYTEKSKSAILLYAIRGAKAREFGGIPQELLQEEKEIKQDLSTYREFLFSEKKLENPDPIKLQLYQNYVFKLTNRYDSVILVFEKGFPEYYALKYDSRIIDYEDVRETLKRNEALIEYSISDTSLISFLITRDKFIVKNESIDSTFWLTVNDLQASLMNSDFSNSIMQEYTSMLKNSNKLYKYLIEPFEDYIEKKQLTIIPDGALAYLPFEILLSKIPDIQKLDYHTLPYLLKSNPINYSYSAALLLNEKAVGRFSRAKLLAFAPKYQNTSILNDKSGKFRRTEFEGLNPLPFSKQEVETIKEITKAKVLIDDEATETEFKELAPHFDILHMAMHTIIDNDSPMYSKLAFTGSEMDTLNDGFLNINELYNLQLNAQLAVLSSCNSGSGKLQKGEGIMSIARGFMYAGCPSVVMTLWEVEDKSGSEIMEKFYRYLKKGYSKNLALRNAKLEFLEEANLLKSHPYFWSAYISLGDNSPVYVAFWPGKIVPVFLIFLLIFLFIWSKKHRKLV